MDEGPETQPTARSSTPPGRTNAPGSVSAMQSFIWAKFVATATAPSDEKLLSLVQPMAGPSATQGPGGSGAENAAMCPRS